MSDSTIRTKDIKIFELTPGVAGALSAALDASYMAYFQASLTGRSTKESEQQIANLSEDKRYLTRVLDSLDNAFADFDTEVALLDLPHMKKCKPEAIKHYLEFRLLQYNMLLTLVTDYLAKSNPASSRNDLPKNINFWAANCARPHPLDSIVCTRLRKRVFGREIWLALKVPDSPR